MNWKCPWVKHALSEFEWIIYPWNRFSLFVQGSPWEIQCSGDCLLHITACLKSVYDIGQSICNYTYWCMILRAVYSCLIYFLSNSVHLSSETDSLYYYWCICFLCWLSFSYLPVGKMSLKTNCDNFKKWYIGFVHFRAANTHLSKKTEIHHRPPPKKKKIYSHKNVEKEELVWNVWANERKTKKKEETIHTYVLLII